MSGMIPHHAQAVVMAGWAPSHGARKDVAILCERIVVGQRDEIAMMQSWLRDRCETRGNPDDAELAARSRPDGSRRGVDAPQDEDERRRARDADARDADRRG